jgi:hypothetical protein
MLFFPDSRSSYLGQEAIRGGNNHHIHTRVSKSRFPTPGSHRPWIAGGKGLSPSQVHISTCD